MNTGFTLKRVAYIYLIKSQLLWFDDRTEPYCNYSFISINHPALLMHMFGWAHAELVSQISVEVFPFFFSCFPICPLGTVLS